MGAGFFLIAAIVSGCLAAYRMRRRRRVSRRHIDGRRARAGAIGCVDVDKSALTGAPGGIDPTAAGQRGSGAAGQRGSGAAGQRGSGNQNARLPGVPAAGDVVTQKVYR